MKLYEACIYYSLCSMDPSILLLSTDFGLYTSFLDFFSSNSVSHSLMLLLSLFLVILGDCITHIDDFSITLAIH